MAAARRGQLPMKVELPSNASLASDLPPISALFLIYFDIKAGYTIGWKRSLPGIELEGVVEYKSLPSGLHTVKEDLIYYVHDRFAGVSAFVNAPADEEARNARMIAVGVLLPLSFGRLGRSWKHAEQLQAMAQELVVDQTKTEVLEGYWDSHRQLGDSKETENSLGSPSNLRFKSLREQPGRSKGHTRNRSASDGTVLLPPGHNLSAHHPAWSLTALLDTFGPLIFPIYRAALLRRRILIAGHAPVHETCDFVYNLSVLSNIPLAVSDLLSPGAPPQRLRPLFQIGIHDIPFLEEDLKAASKPAPISLVTLDEEEQEGGAGWIACTTDDILTVKDALFDLLITMPPAYSTEAEYKVWPKVESAQRTEIKATQRDLRRYRALRWGLSRSRELDIPLLSRSDTGTSSSGRRNSMSGAPPTLDGPLLDLSDTDGVVEPLSWSALAYTGFIWWASAGERRTAMNDEGENDSILLDGLDLDPQTPRGSMSRSQASLGTIAQNQDLTAKKEMAIIAYFHRLTTLILTTVSDIVDATDSDDEREAESSPLRDEDENEGPAVYITSADMAKMGLDEWSASDKLFIEELVQSYFGRKAQLEGRNVDICGIRVC